MMESPDVEDMPLARPARSARPKSLGRRLSAPLVLLLGLLVFLTAVGIDSLQQAAAADMPRSSMALFSATNQTAAAESVSVIDTHQVADVTGTYLEFDETTANRLSRSDLIGSQLTRSRLTSSHLLLRSTQ